MAKFIFKYGQMNSSKTMNLLSTAHNFEEGGKTVLILTSSIDNRYGIGKVTSRIGIQRNATPIDDTVKVYKLVEEIYPDYVLVDEASFLNKPTVMELIKVVDELKIDVICYGLLKDYRGELFEGSSHLLAHADKIEEIKTTCCFCKKKATHILKFVDGKPTYTGEQIEIGGNDTYKSVCRQHYFKGGN
ncbi:thymidine kinase [Brevibacillus laterosporus]|nr:thymidine kinase [Brevibacillus laterosporus]TPG68562.1 thymidine kinase [Brevibacillus laterosporus]